MDRQTGKRILLGAAVLALALIAGLRGGSMVQAIAQSRSERTLVIDAGHGGFDGGATGSNGTVEQDINLSIAQRVQGPREQAGIARLQGGQRAAVERQSQADRVDASHDAPPRFCHPERSDRRERSRRIPCGPPGQTRT